VTTRSRLLANWRHVLRTSNPPAGRVDIVSRWLVITRASVLPMTITAAAIAGLLAAFHDEHVRWGLFALAAVGLVLAHVANNLMNDLFDLEVGSDTDSYPRALYAPHPVLSGMISRRGLLTSAIVVNAADLAILVVLLVFRGWPMAVFALSGFVLSVAYTAPPLRLKKHGLGEATVLVAWVPLIVVLALHKLATVWTPFSRPKPAEPPENFPIWPLWFAALAFVHTRRAGGLLVLGLIVGVILGW